MDASNGTSLPSPTSSAHLPAHLQYVLCKGVYQYIGFLQVLLLIERDPQQALPHTGEEVQGDGDVGSQDNAQ